MFTPQHLELWKTPSDYLGVNPTDYYVVSATHRDADSLQRENWYSIAAALCDYRGIDCKDHDNPSDLLPTVPDDNSDDRIMICISRASHWAVGWVETMLVHKSADKALMLCDSIHASLADYPIVDDDRLSEIESNDEQETWDNCQIGDDFVGAIQDRFGIEFDDPDSDKTRELFDRLCSDSGDCWEHSGNEVIYPDFKELVSDMPIMAIRQLGKFERL